MSTQHTSPTTDDRPTATPSRSVSIAHLVFGLVFAGIAVLWLVGELTDVDAPGFALWGPAVLIGAGVVGLVASFAGTRRRSRPAPAAPAAPAAAQEEHVAAAEPVEPVETVETVETASETVTESTVVLPDADDEDTRALDDSEEER